MITIHGIICYFSNYFNKVWKVNYFIFIIAI